jgi:hypothetical protein
MNIREVVEHVSLMSSCIVVSLIERFMLCQLSSELSEVKWCVVHPLFEQKDTTHADKQINRKKSFGVPQSWSWEVEYSGSILKFVNARKIIMTTEELFASIDAIELVVYNCITFTF